MSIDELEQPSDLLAADAVRDPLAMSDALSDALRRPMPERLALALSWNEVAAELRAGLAKVTGRIGS